MKDTIERLAWPRWAWGLMALLALGVLGWWGWQARAGAAPKRVVIMPFTPVNDRVVAGFKEVMGELGWVEGRNIDYRSLPADGQVEPLSTRLAEHLPWKPDLVLAMSTPPAQAAYRLTQPLGVPLVFAPVSDPVFAGIVRNLAYPGENTTGVRLLPSNGLRLEALKRLVPSVRKVYVPYGLQDKSGLATLEQIRPAAAQLGLELLLQPVVTHDDILRAAQQVPAEAQAIFLPQESRIEAEVGLFIGTAEARRLPLSVPSVLQVEQGALFTYGFDHHAIGRQAGRLVDQVLRGVPPGQLPVESAENHFYLNLRAARAIGLEPPDSLLRQVRLIGR